MRPTTNLPFSRDFESTGLIVSIIMMMLHAWHQYRIYFSLFRTHIIVFLLCNERNRLTSEIFKHGHPQRLTDLRSEPWRCLRRVARDTSEQNIWHMTTFCSSQEVSYTVTGVIGCKTIGAVSWRSSCHSYIIFEYLLHVLMLCTLLKMLWHDYANYWLRTSYSGERNIQPYILLLTLQNSIDGGYK